MFRPRTTLEGSWKEQKLPTVGGKKDREAKREELLHWWNLIHLIDSKWSNSDLARLDRFLSVGIKSSCPGENRDSRRTLKTGRDRAAE